MSLRVNENTTLFNKIKKEIPNASLTLYKNYSDIDFKVYESFICLEDCTDVILKSALQYGVICIGNNERYSINMQHNKIKAIIEFLRNPIKKSELINKIYWSTRNDSHYVQLII